MSRRALREHTFKLIFLNDFHNPEELEQQFQLYAEENELEEVAAEYVLNKVKDMVIHLEEIDNKVSSICENWKISRIGKVELSILRLAVYEINYEDDIPKNVSISEAVELAKKYGGDNSGSFVNGVLAKI